MAQSEDEVRRRKLRDAHLRRIADQLHCLISDGACSEKRIRSTLSSWTYCDLVDVKNLKDKYLTYPERSTSSQRLAYCKLIAAERVSSNTKSSTIVQPKATAVTSLSNPKPVPLGFESWRTKLQAIFNSMIKLRPTLEQHLKSWSDSELRALVECSPEDVAFGKYQRKTLKLCRSIASSYLEIRRQRKAKKTRQLKRIPRTLPSVPKISTSTSRSRCQSCRMYLKKECWAICNTNSDRVPSNARKLCNDCYASLPPQEQQAYTPFSYGSCSVWYVGTGHSKKI